MMVFSALDRGLTKKVEESQQHREIQLVITFQGETPLAIQKLNSGRRRTALFSAFALVFEPHLKQS